MMTGVMSRLVRIVMTGLIGIMMSRLIAVVRVMIMVMVLVILPLCRRRRSLCRAIILCHQSQRRQAYRHKNNESFHCCLFFKFLHFTPYTLHL